MCLVVKLLSDLMEPILLKPIVQVLAPGEMHMKSLPELNILYGLRRDTIFPQHCLKNLINITYYFT